MAITFTAAFNTTHKTLTLTISDYDGNATLDIYVQGPDDDDFALIGEVSSPTTTFAMYYSSGIVTDAEDSVFGDGLYYIKAVADGDADLSDDSAVIVFTAEEAKCCLAQKIGDLSDITSDCKKEKAIKLYFYMKCILEGAEFDATSSCGDYTEAATKLAYVNDYCDSDTNDCFQRNC